MLGYEIESEDLHEHMHTLLNEETGKETFFIYNTRCLKLNCLAKFSLTIQQPSNPSTPQ